ncbi:hypothetical protein Enr13x_53610 [Stieleria neptunia]|uniref:Uncharacterized protein n=1 Tax=Stieleria neptunia TaxID=2527979 RepID=A0A518HX96_9BACT|nr:hypothetical protein Enr13x_53610 [Stieleria neptunia]
MKSSTTGTTRSTRPKASLTTSPATATKKRPKRRKRRQAATADRPETTEKQPDLKIEGLKYFEMLQPLLEHLHDEQCERDTADNRKLHYDQYCMLVLLYVLNPTVSSLRALTQASELAKVQKRLGSSKTSLGSFSEASRGSESCQVGVCKKSLTSDTGSRFRMIHPASMLRAR